MQKFFTSSSDMAKLKGLPVCSFGWKAILKSSEWVVCSEASRKLTFISQHITRILTVRVGPCVKSYSGPPTVNYYWLLAIKSANMLVGIGFVTINLEGLDARLVCYLYTFADFLLWFFLFQHSFIWTQLIGSSCTRRLHEAFVCLQK